MDRRLIFGILTLAVVVGVGFYLYKTSKKTPEVKPKKTTKERVEGMKVALANTVEAKRKATPKEIAQELEGAVNEYKAS